MYRKTEYTWYTTRVRQNISTGIGLYREYAIAIQDEVGDSNGGNV